MLFSLLAALLSLTYLINANGDAKTLAPHCPKPNSFPSFQCLQTQEEDVPTAVCSHHDPAQLLQPEPKLNPWSRVPECLTGKETNDTYCVFTSEGFADGRGISIFTSPSIAGKMRQLPAFVAQNLHQQANDFDNPPWEVKYIPGRGNGLFATRTLHRGDLIMVNTPLGVYQSDALVADHAMAYQNLRKTFDQLPERSKQIFLRMTTHSAGDMIMERINTNAFAGEFLGVPHFFLYPETALMNHDCRPNAMFSHDPSTLVHASHASRTIHQGEEITITYINLLQPHAQRQHALSSTWGFTCTCALCSSNSHLSDTHISRIIALQALFVSSRNGTPKEAEDLLDLYKKEQLHAAIGTGHAFAAQAYNAVGNAKMAVWHAREAIEAGIVVGEDPKLEMENMQALIRSPRTHWSWRKK